MTKKKSSKKEVKADSKEKKQINKSTKAAKGKVPKEPKPKREVYKHVKINFWRTELHGEEIGIHQKLKYQAKTRYFSKGFDIEGKVEIDDEDKYVLAFNKEEWEETPKNQDKRLILRLFTIMEEKLDKRTGGNFVGGFELSILHSLVQSFEVRHPAPVFFVNLPNLKILPRIVKGHRLIGTRWTFPLLPEEKGDKLQMVVCKGKVGMGNDYNVYLGKKLIAEVNHQRIQKDVEIDIFDEFYAKDKTFVLMITFFGCALNFVDEIYKMVKKHVSKMKDTGTSDYIPPKPELDLFLNPRMVRR
ncbi:MAG: hypothetical protein ACTSYC_08760 [Promethearchaeota archaeon]